MARQESEHARRPDDRAERSGAQGSFRGPHRWLLADETDDAEGDARGDHERAGDGDEPLSFSHRGEPAARTVAAIGSLVSVLVDHRADAAAYLHALAHAPAADPLRRGIVALWGELRELLAADIRSQQQTGALDDWVDPPVMAALLVAVANGVVVQATVDPDGARVDALAAQFGSLLLAARPVG